MKEHTTGAPVADETARPRSRKDFFKGLAVAGAGAAGIALSASKAAADSGGAVNASASASASADASASASASASATASASANASASASASAAAVSADIELLNFALTIEYFESEVFYPAALEAGILSADGEVLVARLAEIEVVHRDALIATIESLGGVPRARPEYAVPDYVLASEGAFFEAALAQEITDVGASLGLAPLIQSPDVLAAAGALAGVEGENVVAIRRYLGLSPYANEAFPAALTIDEVTAAVSPFVAGGL